MRGVMEASPEISLDSVNRNGSQLGYAKPGHKFLEWLWIASLMHSWLDPKEHRKLKEV